MVPEDGRRQRVAALWQAVEDGDDRRLRELCTDDFCLVTSNGDRLDLDAWLSKLQRERATDAFEDLRIDLETVLECEDAVAVLGRERRTQVSTFVGVPPSDGDVVLPFCAVFGFDGDRIASGRLVTDQARFLRDVGVLPGDGLAWKLRQQHQDVLNRILRHNLRNDLNAALVRATDVEDETLRRDIQRPVEQLLDLVEKTRRVEQHVLEQSVRWETVDLADVVASVVEEVTDSRPGARVLTDVPGDLPTLETDPNVLEGVLVEAVDNALEHADGGQPRVSVTRDPDGDGVVVDVEDEGEGISEYELAPIRQERETPIVHGSGVGLWAIKWGIDKLGGDVTFEERAEGGTRIRFRVPDRG